jgi:phage shock protein E
MRRLILALLGALLALTTVTACSGDTAPTLDTSGATIIDVRTPGEYTSGHLEGAVNIDVEDGAGFLAAVQSLDPAASYILYCRSGNRSAAATATLEGLGFTNVVDAGGMTDAASATGLTIVTS